MTKQKAKYSNDGVQVYLGDCLDVLQELPEKSVHTCVTSPPYWGLRDYGTATWEGGDDGCDHKQMVHQQNLAACADKYAPVANPRNPNRQDNGEIFHNYRNVCPKCGARRIDSQLGLEATPEEYVAKIVEVFRGVRRVLRDDGTLWLNLGDSYCGYHGNSKVPDDEAPSNRPGYVENMRETTVGNGLKPKDLCGIPWRVALALQANGWYLRQDIIWHKPNPMPESVTDRCTKSHEYLFLLSKSKKYHFDHEAIKEPAVYAGKGRGGSTKRYEQNSAGMDNKEYATRNKRSVWTVNSRPFKGAHFATFPPKLIEPCIKAGCPSGGTVLDPFMGAGTTAVVARELGCKAVGIELNPDYVDIIAKRMEQTSLSFT